jgi:D-glycero-alpha-D-manno-heptose-7-phosphate kinase
MLEPDVQLLIEENESIQRAMEKLDKSAKGFLICQNAEQDVLGVITDGDIRRALLDGLDINAEVAGLIRTNFIAATKGASRESLMKLLDHKIKFVPILNDDRKLLGVVTAETLSLEGDHDLAFRSRAPVRVSFGGGGSDLSHYYVEKDGAVLNAAISLYTHVTMIKRSDSRLIIKSHDVGVTVEADSLQEFLDHPGELKLFAAVLSLIKPEFGFELTVRSDFPVGSGLGGSGTAAVALIGCFNLTRYDRWDRYEVAEIAYQAERLCLSISGGWQDQYAASFGGFNYMEFSSGTNIVNQLKLDSRTRDELEANLLLCNLRTIHDSGAIHDDQQQTMQSTKVGENVEANVKLCTQMKNVLLKGRLENFGSLLNQAWQYKKTFSAKISNTQIDKIYDGACNVGALGGKLLGAGGGGFFIFYVPPERRPDVEIFLSNSGCDVTRFNFDDSGLVFWTSRSLKGTHQAI